MVRKGLSRLSYANVMATIAVFLSLGGVTYAITLPRNSIRTKHIRAGAVTAKKIAKNAVDGSKIKDFSLLASDFKAGQLPGGAKGDPGSQGPPGAAGVTPVSESWREVGTAGQPAFQNNWTNGTASFHSAAFYKDALGVVHLRGLVTGGTAPAIFALPIGYRPPELLYHPATNTNGGPGEVLISPSTGDVNRNSFTTPSGSFSLEGISFRAD